MTVHLLVPGFHEGCNKAELTLHYVEDIPFDLRLYTEGNIATLTQTITHDDGIYRDSQSGICFGTAPTDYHHSDDGEIPDFDHGYFCHHLVASHNNFDLLWHGLTYWNSNAYSDLENVEEEDIPLHSFNFYQEWTANDLLDENNHVPNSVFNRED